MSEEGKLRKRISAYAFAAWELHLFLNTHPDNADALKLQKEYSEKADKLIEEFQEKFGPMVSNQNQTDMWTWVNNPWPWQTEGNE